MANPRDIVDRLMTACQQDERTLRHEASHVDAGRARQLVALADERHGFVEALRALPGSHFGASRSSARAFLRELASDVRATVTGPSPSDAISACRRSHSRTELAYDEALALELAPEVSSVVAAQLARIQAASRQLLQLQF